MFECRYKDGKLVVGTLEQVPNVVIGSDGGFNYRYIRPARHRAQITIEHPDGKFAKYVGLLSDGKYVFHGDSWRLYKDRLPDTDPMMGLVRKHNLGIHSVNYIGRADPIPCRWTLPEACTTATAGTLLRFITTDGTIASRGFVEGTTTQRGLVFNGSYVVVWEKIVQENNSTTASVSSIYLRKSYPVDRVVAKISDVLNSILGEEPEITPDVVKAESEMGELVMTDIPKAGEEAQPVEETKPGVLTSFADIPLSVAVSAG